MRHFRAEQLCLFCRWTLTFLVQLRTRREYAIVAVRGVPATLLSASEMDILLIARIEPARDGDDRDLAAAAPTASLPSLCRRASRPAFCIYTAAD